LYKSRVQAAENEGDDQQYADAVHDQLEAAQEDVDDDGGRREQGDDGQNLVCQQVGVDGGVTGTPNGAVVGKELGVLVQLVAVGLQSEKDGRQKRKVVPGRRVLQRLVGTALGGVDSQIDDHNPECDSDYR